MYRSGNADDADWADLNGSSVTIRPIRVIRVPITRPYHKGAKYYS
jgi:hypothetical protein